MKKDDCKNNLLEVEKAPDGAINKNYDETNPFYCNYMEVIYLQGISEIEIRHSVNSKLREIFKEDFRFFGLNSAGRFVKILCRNI